MRNITEIHFSDTTGNGKFSGKPDLPVEIFFLAPESFQNLPPEHGGIEQRPAAGIEKTEREAELRNARLLVFFGREHISLFTLILL